MTAAPAASDVPAKILVVDDDAAIRELLTIALTRWGFEVDVAGDGVEALELLGHSPPDAVIADIVLPRLDGYGLVREIRANPATSSLPVLFHTANYVERELEEFARATGIVRTLTKPTRLDVLEQAVREAIASRESGAGPQQSATLDREHLRLLSDKLHAKVGELEETNAQLMRVDADRRKLLKHVVTAQEEERRRIAFDVHDDTIQVMTAVALQLHALRRFVSEDGQAKVDHLEEVVNLAIGRLRMLLVEIRPPELDTGDLVTALEGLLERTADETGVRWQLDGAPERQPAREVKAVAYRIVQEALTNVRKHAKASVVSISLAEVADTFVVTVADNGAGFSPGDPRSHPPGHFGVLQMREQAELTGGWLRLDSEPGRGTTVVFGVPVEQTAR